MYLSASEHGKLKGGQWMPTLMVNSLLFGSYYSRGLCALRGV